MKYFQITLFCFLITLLNLNAQNTKLSGLIKYQLTSYGFDDTLKSGITSEYELVYKDNEISYFFNNYSKALNDTQSLPPKNDKKILKQYQNLNTKVMLNVDKARSEHFLIKDTMQPITWKLSKKTKKIQNIECFNAIAEYRGRVWTAWYAPSIPVSSGPWKLYGLPGMILEAEDIKRCVRFECLSIIIPSNEKIEIPQHKDKQKNDSPIDSRQFGIIYERNILNAEKMSIKVQNGVSSKSSSGVSSIEIFDFEKNLTMKRFQQKLSDIPKK